jgi:hypothetical protein
MGVSRIVTGLLTGAALLASTTMPAFAGGYGGVSVGTGFGHGSYGGYGGYDDYGRHHRRHRNGVDAGDVNGANRRDSAMICFSTRPPKRLRR